MEYISSPKNDRIKTAKKLTVKKHQKDAGRYLLEGRHLVQEALASGQTPYDIYATESMLKIVRSSHFMTKSHRFLNPFLSI